jgi:hypothetical protein
MEAFVALPFQDREPPTCAGRVLAQRAAALMFVALWHTPSQVGEVVAHMDSGAI